MPLNEPRIFENKPRWVGLPEIERNETTVKFKSKFGYMIVPIKQVEDWEGSH